MQGARLRLATTAIFRLRLLARLLPIRGLAAETALLQGQVCWKRVLDHVDEAGTRSHHRAWLPMPQ